jgi:hypothetical protein
VQGGGGSISYEIDPARFHHSFHDTMTGGAKHHFKPSPGFGPQPHWIRVIQRLESNGVLVRQDTLCALAADHRADVWRIYLGRCDGRRPHIPNLWLAWRPTETLDLPGICCGLLLAHDHIVLEGQAEVGPAARDRRTEAIGTRRGLVPEPSPWRFFIDLIGRCTSGAKGPS